MILISIPTGVLDLVPAKRRGETGFSLRQRRSAGVLAPNGSAEPGSPVFEARVLACTAVRSEQLAADRQGAGQR